MSKNDNLDLKKVEQRKDELKMVLQWKIVPQLNPMDQYRVTIAYNTEDSSNSENIKILGFYKGSEVATKILGFFDKFLGNVESFGLLVESNIEGAKNWDISFSRSKK